MNIRAVIGLLILVEVILESGFLVDTSWVQGFSLKNGLLYGLLLLSLPNVARAGRQLPRPALQALIAFLLLCGWTVLTTLWGSQPPRVGENPAASPPLVLVKGLVIDSAVAYAVFAVGMGQRTNFLALSRWLVGILAVFCALAIFEVRSVGESIYGTASDALGRNQGPFGEVNQSAAIIAMIIPIAVAWTVRLRGLWRVAFAASAALMLGSLLLTGSRGGVLATVAAIVPLLFVLHREGRLSQRLMLLIALPVVLIVGWTVIPESSRVMVMERLLSLQRVSEDVTQASSGRITLWKIGLGIWSESKVVGHGWGYYQSVVGSPTHNEYLMYLVESGLIGAALYLMIWGSALLLAHRAWRTSAGDTLIVSAFYGSILGAMTGVFFVNLYKPGLFMWGTIGLVVGYFCQLLRPAKLPHASRGERFDSFRRLRLRGPGRRSSFTR